MGAWSYTTEVAYGSAINRSVSLMIRFGSAILGGGCTKLTDEIGRYGNTWERRSGAAFEAGGICRCLVCYATSKDCRGLDLRRAVTEGNDEAGQMGYSSNTKGWRSSGWQVSGSKSEEESGRPG
jgi:hypothetical protein